MQAFAAAVVGEREWVPGCQVADGLADGLIIVAVFLYRFLFPLFNRG